MKQENNDSKTENADGRMEMPDSSVENVRHEEGQGEAKKETKQETKKETKEGHIKDQSTKGQSTQKENSSDREKSERKSEEENGRKPEGKGKKKSGKKAAQKAGKKKRILIPVGILVVLITAGFCAYSAIAYSYRDKFLPGTWINGIDCTEMDGAQVAGLLESQLQAYYLDITGRDYASGVPGTAFGRVTAEDIRLTYGDNSRKAVDWLLAGQNCFTWLYRRWSDNTYSFQLSQEVSYDKDLLRNIVKGWEACQPGNMTEPKDACISGYSEKLKGYEVVPEVEGTKFDVEKLLELIDVAILSRQTSLDLEEEGCYETPAVRQDAAELTEPVETANKWLGARITYDWNGAEVTVDAELLKDWITMEKDGPVLDETAVAAFVKEQAEANDTYGKRRSFMTTLGVELSLPSGYYGWLTDQEAERSELIRAISAGKTVSREPVYASTARQKGMSDIGNSYVEVDLTHQHLYLYEGGTIVFETDFVSGNMSSTPDCVTPEGVFGIAYKTTNAVLRGANYETPVNYWMPFYGNYGLHDATWRSEFGGQIYITDGSHGCVNLPLDAAATIYGHMSTGFPVICYYYQVDPLAQPVEENWDDEDEE